MATEFLPARSEGELPALRVDGGVLVYGYWHAGILHVTVDTTDAGRGPVPVRVHVNNGTVWEGVVGGD